MKRVLLLTVLLAACTAATNGVSGCASGPPPPAALDTKNESCAWCRMAISEARFAGQIVAAAEEPLFFDDIGCLAHFLAGAKERPAGTVTYVADHRTRSWVRADTALYTEVATLATPMGSHLIAHADVASRDADPEAKGGSPRTAAEVFGAGGPPGAAR
jgi:copper chaperone NosL